MKVTSVEFHPAGSSEAVVLSFRDPRRLNPYNMVALVGLDADSIVAKYYRGSGAAGQKFYNMSLEKRDVVARIQLNPDYGSNETPSDLRDELYRIISSSRTGLVQIQFKNGANVVAVVSGLVTKLEAPHSTKTPEAQITFSCTEPLLKALYSVAVDVSELDPADTLVNDPLSTSPYGFKFEMGFTGPVASFVMSDPDDPSWSFEVAPDGGFVAGDVLYFSSENKDKYLYMIRDSIMTHLADVILPGSLWPILFPGDNRFTFDTPANMEWNVLTYFPTYWGV